MPIRSTRVSAGRRVRQAATLLPACALIAACSSSEEPDASGPTPEPTLTPNPVMTAAPDGSAMTPGEWLIEENGDGAQARFGPVGGEARFAMVCDRATRTLTVTQAGDAATGTEGEQTYILEAGGRQARLDMTPTGGEPPMLRAAIDRTQPVFQGFAQLGSAISITSPGGEVLRMPGAPGISRVIEACS